jgi:ABC-2 type transport system permease protein
VKGWSAIFRRELAGLFFGPLAWVLLFLALLINGAYFNAYLVAGGGRVNESLALTLGGSWLYWVVMLLFPPLLTMRMISEEARGGMLEFLLTAPATDAAVITGKLLAATVFMLAMHCSALVYALALAIHGAQLDWGVVAGGMLGSLLTSALFCALGLVSSALTSTPLVAAVVAILAGLALFSLRILGSFMAQYLHLPSGHWSEQVLRQIDIVGHFQGSFLLGVFDTAHVVFFLAWTGFLAFLAVRLLETRRWR